MEATVLRLRIARSQRRDIRAPVECLARLEEAWSRVICSSLPGTAGRSGRPHPQAPVKGIGKKRRCESGARLSSSGWLASARSANAGELWPDPAGWNFATNPRHCRRAAWSRSSVQQTSRKTWPSCETGPRADARVAGVCNDRGERGPNEGRYGVKTGLRRLTGMRFSYPGRPTAPAFARRRFFAKKKNGAYPPRST